MKEDLPACKIPTLCSPRQALSHLRILGGAHGGGEGGRAAGRGHLPLSHVALTPEVWRSSDTMMMVM